MAGKKRKVGLLTFSDGRKPVYDSLLEMNRQFQAGVKRRLEDTGEFEVVAGEIIGDSRQAREEAASIAKAGVEMTIFNFAVWCYPGFGVIAADFAPGPYLLFSNINPKFPGMVGMLSTSGALDMLGIFNARAWGDIKDDTVLRKIVSFLRAATAVNRLRGETFGLFGGRPMGMYTAVADLDQWQKQFGIDYKVFGKK